MALENLPGKIKEFRERRDLNQEELGKLVGVDRSAVAKWESGANIPSLENMVEIAKALRSTVDELLGLRRRKGKKG